MGKTRPQKKVKNELVFDNKEREDFLKGFSKRKLQRKKAAKEESERKLKIEVKRIRDETKNLKDKFKQSFKPIEELKDVLSDSDEENVLETEDVTVTISAIKPDELAKKNFIGYRKVQVSESEEEEEDEPDVAAAGIPGMETTKEKKKSKEVIDKNFLKLTEKLKTEKDVKKMIKQQAKTAMKKSKIIKAKNDSNHKKNVKMSQRKKFRKEKILRKHKKIPKHKSK